MNKTTQKYSRMDTARLVWEHDKLKQNLKQLNKQLLKHGIKAR